MTQLRPRPLVLPCTAFTVCAACAPEGAPWLAPAVAAVGTTALAIFFRRSHPASRALITLAAALAGVVAGALAWEGARARTIGWLPEDGTAREGRLEGTILRAPERISADEYFVFAALRPAPDPDPRAAPARIRLRVRTAARGPDAALLELRHGDLVEIWGRVRGPEGAEGALAWHARGLDASGSVKNTRLVERRARGARGARRLLDHALAWARGRLDRALGAMSPERAVAGAMLLGDRASLDPETTRALRESGLYHVLAISGINVGLAVLAAVALLRRAGVPPAGRAIVGLPALWGFAMLVGGDAPVSRACLGAAVALAARACGRDGDGLNTLALAAALLALSQPASAADPGFQLTFAATAGLLLFGGRATQAAPGPRVIAAPVALSAAAYVATAPILAIRFGRLSPAGLIANLAAGPLCAMVLASGTAAIALAGAGPAGDISAWALASSVRALTTLASVAASLPCASVRVAPPGAAHVVAYTALVVALALAPPSRCVAARLARAALSIGLLAMHLGRPPSETGRSLVAVLDVGQGQAVAVRGADGRCALFDAGGSGGGRFDAGDRIVTPFFAAWGCRRLESVVLSHGHDDHAGGLASILSDFDVGSLWIGAGHVRDPLARHAASLAVARGTAVKLAEDGAWGRAGGMRWEILHPERSDHTLPINDRCVVVRLETAGGATALVPGDLERDGERLVLGRGSRLEAGLLVAGHHGAAASTTAGWLDAVHPQWAAVSVGTGNRFGHPGPATMRRLHERGIATLRTDRLGTIVFEDEGATWRVAGVTRRSESERE